MSSYPNGQSWTSAPSTGSSIERFRKSMSQKRGVFASQWIVPPPTVAGR